MKKDLLERMKAFRKLGRLQKEIIKLMVIIFDDFEEVERLRYMFYYIDQGHKGVLTIEEIKTFFNNFGEAVSDGDIEDVIKDFNLRFKNSLTITEFLAITVDPFFYRDDRNVLSVYNRIRAQVYNVCPDDILIWPIVWGDKTEPLAKTGNQARLPILNGHILSNGLNKFGLRMTPELFAKMLKEIKPSENKDEVIDYEEFSRTIKHIVN